jgi:hypothetical protein
VDPVPDTLLLSENVVAPGIEPEPLASVARNSDHRGGHQLKSDTNNIIDLKGFNVCTMCIKCLIPVTI